MPMSNLPIKTGHVFIGLAVVMGITTMLLFSGGKREVPKIQEKVETETVVVPLVTLNRGQTVSRTDVTAVEWPKAFLPKGSVFNDPFKVVGRVAKQDLFPGEPIFLQKVSGSNTRGGLPALIPTGMRAITISVTEVKGVAGFVKPGDRVDVLSTFEIPKEGGHDLKKTKTVLQDVLVLASAQTMVDGEQYDIQTPEGVSSGNAVSRSAVETQGKDKNKDKGKDKEPSTQDLEKQAKDREKAKKEAEKAARLVSSVTLALTPAQTETLALAEETGDLRLSLRSETDHAIAKLNGADTDKLLGRPAPPPFSAPAPPPARFSPPPPMPAPVLGAQVEFIQGSDKTIYRFTP